MPYDSTLRRLEDLSKFDFPVEERDVFTLIGSAPKKVPNATAIVRSDTGAVLAMHTKKYKLTPHVDIFRGAIEALKGQVDFDGATVVDNVFNNGARVMREIRFPAHALADPTGKAVHFRLRQVNSYDASSAYHQIFGSFRLVCLNGAVALDAAISGMYRKHTTAIDADAEQGRLAKALEAFKDEAGIWRIWSRAKVTDAEINTVFRHTLAAQPTVADPKNINKRQFERLMQGWDDHKAELGGNLWAAYNTATWWASHGEGRSRPAEQISIERDWKVRSMVGHETWKQLEAA